MSEGNAFSDEFYEQTIEDLRAKLEAAKIRERSCRSKLRRVETVLDAAERERDELLAQVNYAEHVLRADAPTAIRAAEADRDRYREALERIADPRHAKCCPVAVGLARKALDLECPAGGPHTISPDDTECVECGARRPERVEEGK